MTTHSVDTHEHFRISASHAARLGKVRKGEPQAWTVQVFFDGDCPLCVREIAMLSRLDRKQRIWFTDIAPADFRAGDWGTTYADLSDRIRGRLPSGEWVEGVEVFRLLYGAIGLAPLIPLTRLPGVKQLLDFGYEKFAKNRLKWTGRCVDGVCEVPSNHSAKV